MNFTASAPSSAMSVSERAALVAVPGIFVLLRTLGIRAAFGSVFFVLTTLLVQPSWLIGGLKAFSNKQFGKDVLFFDAPQAKHNKDEPPLLALTIDDCPGITRKGAISHSSLCDILKTLEQYNARATLFVMNDGVNAENEALLIKALRQGHELGNHHVKDEVSAALPPTEFALKMRMTDRLLRRVRSASNLTIPPNTRLWFRPGGGFITPRQARIAHNYGYRIGMGSLVMPDPIIRAPRFTAWLLCKRARPGGVVVIHDRPWTSDMLKRALPHLTTHFKVVTLSELERSQTPN